MMHINVYPCILIYIDLNSPSTCPSVDPWGDGTAGRLSYNRRAVALCIVNLPGVEYRVVKHVPTIIMFLECLFSGIRSNYSKMEFQRDIRAQ